MQPVLWLLGAAWAAITLPLALTLIVVAATTDGTIFGVTAVLFGLAPVIAAGGKAAGRRSRLQIAGALVFFVVALATWLAYRAPTGTSSPTAKVRHIYRDGGDHFRRFALGNILPEADQLALGLACVPLVDPLLSQHRAAQVRTWTRKIYAELERDPEFHALGSVMPDAYDEWWGRRPDRGHAFLYVPAQLDRSRPAPTLVFLHGSGGNFKAYLWLLSRIADRLGFVIVAPSYGMGNWRRADTAGIVHESLRVATSAVAIDAANVHVMALSNGGLGACQLLRGNAQRFRSFIFLSPIFDLSREGPATSLPALDGVPVFVVTGARDDRAPISYVDDNARDLAAAGARVSRETVADGDHFIFFSHREQVQRSLEDWLRRNGATVNRL